MREGYNLAKAWVGEPCKVTQCEIWIDLKYSLPPEIFSTVFSWNDEWIISKIWEIQVWFYHILVGLLPVMLLFKVRCDCPGEDAELQRGPHIETAKGLRSQGISICTNLFLSLCFLLMWPWPRFSMVAHPQHHHSLPHGGRQFSFSHHWVTAGCRMVWNTKEKSNKIVIKSRITHSSDLFSPLKVLKIRILPLLNNKHLLRFIICFCFD